MKTLSVNVVEIVLMYLILRDGKTTTLDIKNELRSMGYKAVQKEVSEFSQIIVNAVIESCLTIELEGQPNQLVVTDNGKYREISLEIVEDEDEMSEEDIKNHIKTFISRNPGVPSKEISELLAESGITMSSRSIAAIKANMNR